MEKLIRNILNQYTLNIDKSKLMEGSKRVKLSSRTISDLNYVVDKIWSDYLKKNDEEPLKGTILVKDPSGAEVSVPVYYLSNFQSQGAVFSINPDKPRNLYNLFLVVNPEETLVPSKKSLYNLIYHELQHLMDLHTTSYLTPKEMSKYDPEVDTKYWGHDFEFRAYANEILEGLVNEYRNLYGVKSKEELLSSLKSVLEFFGKSGQVDKIGRDVFYNISSENPEQEDYPFAIQTLALLRQFNPKRWKEFLKMLYSTVAELVKEIKEMKSEGEIDESKKFKKPRKWGPSYCKKTPCGSMGFSQKASCRPYKNCYK
jgi:hypothetical protein